MSLLGKNTRVPERYAPELLDPIPRQPARKELDFGPGLPFRGEDVWHAWELAWLEQGQPRAAVARIVLPCESPNIIESKSLKLYLASLNHTSFPSSTELQALLQTDGIKARVLSVPAWELIDADNEINNLDDGTVRIAVEAGVGMGWERFTGSNGGFVGMDSFGASAPAKDLYKHFGITAEAAAEAALARLNKR